MQNASNIPNITGKVKGGPEKLDTVKLLDPGFHPARLYSIVHLGKQFNTNFNKWTEKIEFVFEFPGLRQKFYEDDTEPRPTVSSTTFTVSMSKKSNLRPFIENMLGKKFTDVDAEVFNLFTLIDKNYMIQINHSEPNQQTGDVYANVVGASVYQPTMVPQGVDMTPYNDVHLYHIPTHGFNSPLFGNLPSFKREKIMASEEGISHKKAGGTFAEPEQKSQGSTAQPPTQPASAPPPSAVPPQANQKPQLVMLVNDYTYDQYIATGWTDQKLVQHGKAKWSTPVAVNAPSAPSGPVSPPSAPPPVNGGSPVLDSIAGDGDDSDLDGVPIV